MSKLTIQAVNKAHQAAADMNTKANKVYDALRIRLNNDIILARRLVALVEAVEAAVLLGDRPALPAEEFRDQLEPTANSYGFTLADHPTRRDLVVVQPLEN